MKALAIVIAAGVFFSAQANAGIDSKAEMRDGQIICKERLSKGEEAQRRDPAAQDPAARVEKAADVR